jgi:hypothetical protein
MIFVRRFCSEGETRAFSVERHLVGWAVREEANNEIVRIAYCHDWHRVERVMTMFEQKASELRRCGWRELPAPE